MVKKNRLDQELVRRGLVPSREKAQAVVMAGEVRVDGETRDKSDFRVDTDMLIEIQPRHLFASRGAYKLERAVVRFGLTVTDQYILDIGISTGGFSDFLLQHGARGICGVDVTVSQVDIRLRRNPRVVLIEKNARYLTTADVPERPELIVVDLSFISILKIIPVLKLFPDSLMLVLIKPQFEAEKGKVGKCGVIRDREKRMQIVLGLKRKLEAAGFSVLDGTRAGLPGKKGNQEYFFLLMLKTGRSCDENQLIAHLADDDGIG